MAHKRVSGQLSADTANTNHQYNTGSNTMEPVKVARKMYQQLHSNLENTSADISCLVEEISREEMTMNK